MFQDDLRTTQSYIVIFLGNKMLKIILALLVMVHFVLVFSVAVAFILVPFREPWYVSLPICIWIVHLVTSKTLTCPLTEWENALRRRLGMRQIGGFVGFYFLKPARKLKKWYCKKSNECDIIIIPVEVVGDYI